MSLQDQKYCILDWLVGEELASDIIRGNDILTTEAIPSDKNFPYDLSDNVNISLIKDYCQEEAYNKILQHMKTKSKYLKCGYCNKRLNKSTKSSNNVTCEMRLRW